MKEMTLKLEDLFFLGTTMEGRYIDYAYIAAMPDIGQERALFDQACRERLKKAGLLEEDFWENLMVDAEASDLLSPIFFGAFEAEIIADGFHVRLHQQDSQRSMTVIEDEKITIQALGDDELEALIRKLMGKGPVIVKNAVFGGSAVVNAYPVLDEAAFQETLAIVKEDGGYGVS